MTGWCSTCAWQRRVRWPRADETNYFNNNIGSGIQFAAIAGQVYEVMRKVGGAREIPPEWLTQTIRN